MDFRRTYYLLPNLFTLSCAMCGFTSLSLSAMGRGDTDLYLAALAICFGFFFDTVDGRVARLTRTQTDLGRELDSLADVITFGAAPALLMYKWGLATFGRLGILIAAVFMCAGALRLARFNVLSQRADAGGQHQPGAFMLGLPIPAAASILVSMVIVSHNAGEYRVVSESGTAAIVLVLSALMVSRVRFRSFKQLRLNKRTIGVLLLITGASVAWVRAGQEKAFIFLFLMLAYVILGLAEEIIFFRSRRAEERAQHESLAQAPGSDKDEEVLRELGAFDPTEDEAGGSTKSVQPAATPSPPAATPSPRRA